MEEQETTETGEEKTWNLQLLDWFTTSNYTRTQAAEKLGIPRSTFHDYISGRSNDLNKVVPKRRKALFSLTGLEVFKYNETVEESKEGKSYQGSRSTNLLSALDSIENNVRDLKRTLINKGAEMLLNGGNEPTQEERRRIVETAIDLLVDQMNYFSNTTQKEREGLVEYMQGLGEVERWGYVSNIFNQLHKPSGGPDTFLRSMRPPEKMRGDKR